MCAIDWETIVLERVERHVESLSTWRDAPPNLLNESGWEETALLALRRHELEWLRRREPVAT